MSTVNSKTETSVSMLNTVVALMRISSVVLWAFAGVLVVMERPRGYVMGIFIAWFAVVSILYLDSLWRFGRFIALW